MVIEFQLLLSYQVIKYRTTNVNVRTFAILHNTAQGRPFYERQHGPCMNIPPSIIITLPKKINQFMRI